MDLTYKHLPNKVYNHTGRVQKFKRFRHIYMDGTGETGLLYDAIRAMLACLLRLFTVPDMETYQVVLRGGMSKFREFDGVFISKFQSCSALKI